MYRHTNPNMVPSVILGVQEGERLAGDPYGDATLVRAYGDLEMQTAALVAPGDRPFVVGAFLKAKALAHTQGFIAAYRTATEFPS